MEGLGGSRGRNAPIHSVCDAVGVEAPISMMESLGFSEESRRGQGVITVTLGCDGQINDQKREIFSRSV